MGRRHRADDRGGIVREGRALGMTKQGVARRAVRQPVEGLGWVCKVAVWWQVGRGFWCLCSKR